MFSFELLHPEPALTIPFPDNEFPSTADPKVPTSVSRSPRLCSLVSFLIAFITPFKKMLQFSRA